MNAERERAVEYIRRMSEPESGFYHRARNDAISQITASILLRRIATDIKMGEHVRPERVNNPELWK